MAARRVAARSAAAGGGEHRAGSRRACSRARCSVTCSGAFTGARADRAGRFELADGGTLFLDEIANVPLAQQAQAAARAPDRRVRARRGSRADARIDVRLICATNADLRAEVEAGRFREDLLFRINTVEIRLPPLRERREDIAHLAAHFLAPPRRALPQAAVGLRRRCDAVPCSSTPWPGNVRELDHAIERAVLMSGGAEVRALDLALRAPPTAGARLEDMTLEEVERVLIEKALRRHGGNVLGGRARRSGCRAARSTGASASTDYEGSPARTHRAGPCARPRRVLYEPPAAAPCVAARPARPASRAPRRRSRRARDARAAVDHAARSARRDGRSRCSRSARGWGSRSPRASASHARCRRYRTCWPRCAKATSRSARGTHRATTRSGSCCYEDQHPERDPARAAAQRPRGHGAAPARHGGDRRRHFRLRRRAAAQAREPHRRAAAAASGRVPARARRARARARRGALRAERRASSISRFRRERGDGRCVTASFARAGGRIGCSCSPT